jgi:hypothetical protein
MFAAIFLFLQSERIRADAETRCLDAFARILADVPNF